MTALNGSIHTRYAKSYGYTNIWRSFKSDNGTYSYSYSNFLDQCKKGDKACTRASNLWKVFSTIGCVILINTFCCYCGGCGICKACQDKSSNCCKRQRKQDI